MKRNLFSFFALLMTLATMMSAQPTRKPEGLHIEVLVFSGRPNPVLTITDPAEIRSILALVNSLPGKPAPVPANSRVEPKKLGYRGIAVENLSDVAADVESFVAYRSSIKMTRKQGPVAKAGNASETRHDQAAALENKLLEIAHAKGVLNEKVLAYIKDKK